MVMYLWRDADLHTAQLMPLLLTVSCSRKSKLVLGLRFWYRLTRVVLDAVQRAVKRLWLLLAASLAKRLLLRAEFPSVGLPVCPLVTTVNSGKTADAIEMLFGPKESSIRRAADPLTHGKGQFLEGKGASRCNMYGSAVAATRPLPKFLCDILTAACDRECVSSCPQTTYEKSGVCVTCPLPCDQCVEKHNTSVTCLSCVVGRYLVAIDNVTSCTGLCPDQHYAGIPSSELFT